MAAASQPLTPQDKPSIPPWNPPEATTADLDWAQLRTIELSQLDSPDAKVVAALIETTKTAIKEDGFLYVTNYGISLPQLHRQFAIAQHLHTTMTSADKSRLLWNPDSGTFAGYKPRTGWKRTAGEEDGIEQFNFYSAEFKDPAARVPGCVLPFMDEITAFCDFLRDQVSKRLFVLLSRVLELPDQWLWDHVQSRDDTPVGEGYFRHAMFHALDEKTRQKREAVRMYGELRNFHLSGLFHSSSQRRSQIRSAKTNVLCRRGQATATTAA